MQHGQYEANNAKNKLSNKPELPLNETDTPTPIDGGEN